MAWASSALTTTSLLAVLRCALLSCNFSLLSGIFENHNLVRYVFGVPHKRGMRNIMWQLSCLRTDSLRVVAWSRWQPNLVASNGHPSTDFRSDRWVKLFGILLEPLKVCQIFAESQGYRKIEPAGFVRRRRVAWIELLALEITEVSL